MLYEEGNTGHKNVEFKFLYISALSALLQERMDR